MAIENLNGRTDPPAEVYEQVKKWVDEKEFGSPEYQAINDYLELESLRGELSIYLGNSLSAKDLESGARSASSIRITEGQIILLEDHIRERRSQQKGYEATFVRMESILDDGVIPATDREAEQEFPAEKVKQAGRSHYLYTDFMYDLRDIVYRKREGSSSMDK
jgi:hypothetical protein